MVILPGVETCTDQCGDLRVRQRPERESRWRSQPNLHRRNPGNNIFINLHNLKVSALVGGIALILPAVPPDSSRDNTISGLATGVIHRGRSR